MLLVRSLLFYLGQIISTLLFAPVCVIVFPLKFNARYYLVTRWTVFNLWWLRICCGVYYEIKGQEHIPQQAGIVMCKHQSAFETLALQLIFIPQVWILKRELLKIPIYGWGLASMQPIAIDRGSAIKSFRQIVQQGCIRLQQKRWVIIFPEGTRIAPGQKGEYLPGGGMKKPCKITLDISPLIETKGKSAKQITREVENWIETTVKTLPNPTAD